MLGCQYFLNVVGSKISPTVATGFNNKIAVVGSVTTFSCITNTTPPCFIWQYRAVADSEPKGVCYEFGTNNIFVEPKCNVTRANNNRASLLTMNKKLS